MYAHSFLWFPLVKKSKMFPLASNAQTLPDDIRLNLDPKCLKLFSVDTYRFDGLIFIVIFNFVFL